LSSIRTLHRRRNSSRAHPFLAPLDRRLMTRAFLGFLALQFSPFSPLLEHAQDLDMLLAPSPDPGRVDAEQLASRLEGMTAPYRLEGTAKKMT